MNGVTIWYLIGLITVTYWIYDDKEVIKVKDIPYILFFGLMGLIVTFSLILSWFLDNETILIKKKKKKKNE